MTYVIGVDFDNTITSCDEVIHRVASEMGLVDPAFPKIKKRIRDAIRLLPDGDIEWQRVQGAVYGPRMNDAVVSAGAAGFFRLCRRRDVPVFVVSHKTRFAPYDPSRTNLRDAAIHWLTAQGFMDKDRIGLPRHNVFFEDTRERKIARIIELGCTHFIDDLIETFRESSFPEHVVRILYAPYGHTEADPGVSVFGTWNGIEDYLFHEIG